MFSYAILSYPGHNRVYHEESKKICLAELEIACSCLHTPCVDLSLTSIANVAYFTFTAVDKLSEQDINLVSRLSFVYAIFEILVFNERDKLCLLPIAKADFEYFDSGISSILKYTGKTNELFTKMMINVAVLSGGVQSETTIELLDPIAGKGTTLFEGIISGFNVSGIEIGTKAVHESVVYFKKFLETEKFKHSYKKETFNKDSIIHKFEFARTKDDYKKPENLKQLTMVAGNSIYADKYFKKNKFHVIVGDLPYGVAHGNVTNEKQSSLTRNPDELLKACLPAWYNVLKPNGVIVLAWNKFVLSAEELGSILESNKFTVLSDPPYDKFEHRVDQAIKRDIIVAKKI